MSSRILLSPHSSLSSSKSSPNRLPSATPAQEHILALAIQMLQEELRVLRLYLGWDVHPRCPLCYQSPPIWTDSMMERSVSSPASWPRRRDSLAGGGRLNGLRGQERWSWPPRWDSLWAFKEERLLPSPLFDEERRVGSSP
ncbi:MAG: hypothetical protein M1817_004086 [Caeruleum heppii]|nr:MAG: hypothetical protein M1817_004086 [Caeruleum heppii]